MSFHDSIHDFRVALRSLRRAPAFTAIAVITLALGIGATTGIFSVVDGVLLRPLPYDEPGELVLLTTNLNAGEISDGGFSGPEYRELQRGLTTTDQVAAMFGVSTNLVGENSAESVVLSWVTPNFFDMIDVGARIGRTLTADDQVMLNPQLFQDGTVPPPLIGMLSFGAWQRLYGGDPSILGRITRVNGQTIQIVGVMREGFGLQLPPTVSMPVNFDVMTLWPFELGNMPPGPSGFVNVLARMKDGVTLEQTQIDAGRVAGGLREASTAHARADYEIAVARLHDEVVGNVQTPLFVLLGTVGFVLLIACANVANLLLVRASRQEREIAIRVALGSGRGAIVRRMLAESVVLGAVGLVAGLLVANWGIDLLLTLKPSNLPRLDNVALNSTVLLFTVGISVIAVGVFSLIPVLQTSGADPSAVLKDNVGSGAGAKHRVRNGITVVEVAVSVILLVGAGLMARSFQRLASVDPGFEPEGVLTFRFALPVFTYRTDEARADFFERLDARLDELPGVVAAGAVTPLPLADLQWDTRSNYSVVSGTPDESDLLQASYHPTTPGYFQAMGIRVRSGRAFSPLDTRYGDPVVIVDRKLAERHWPGQDPVGKPLTVFLQNNAFAEIPAVQATIIGVVDDVKYAGLSLDEPGSIYIPMNYVGSFAHDFAVRTQGDPLALVPAVRSAVRSVANDVPVDDFALMTTYVARDSAQTRFVMIMLGVFSGLALILASIGLYGVISYGVRQRTHELGVRVALGASRGKIVRLVIGEGVRLTLVGLMLGGAGAVLLSRILANLLFGVSGTDVPTYAGIAGLLVIVAIAATYFPARRASRVHPARVLRVE